MHANAIKDWIDHKLDRLRYDRKHSKAGVMVENPYENPWGGCRGYGMEEYLEPTWKPRWPGSN